MSMHAKKSYTDPIPPRTIAKKPPLQPLSPNNISWNKKIETSVKEIGEKSKGYKIMHIQAARKVSRKYNWYMYSGIFLGPLSGLLSSIGTLINNPDIQTAISITAMCFGFAAGFVINAAKNGKFEAKSSHHKLAASKYTSLESNVRRQLVLNRSARRVDAGSYLEYIGNEFDELFLASPFVSKHIYEEYIKIAQEHGLDVPDEYGLTINVDKSYRKRQVDEIRNISEIGVNDSPPDSETSDILLTIENKIPKSSNMDKRNSLDEEKFKGTEIKRTDEFTHFPDLNKYSDGRMEYEMQRMMGIK